LKYNTASKTPPPTIWPYLLTLIVKCARLRIAKTFLLDNDTPTLNALKALRAAPTSMGRGETPVERQPAAILFADYDLEMLFCCKIVVKLYKATI
jgi:hypothetical protein